jgi:hypothetical protein
MGLPEMGLPEMGLPRACVRPPPSRVLLPGPQVLLLLELQPSRAPQAQRQAPQERAHRQPVHRRLAPRSQTAR